MPKVGKAHYPYTPKGMKAAKAAAKKSGMPMKMMDKAKKPAKKKAK